MVTPAKGDDSEAPRFERGMVVATLIGVGLFVVPFGHERLISGQPPGAKNDLRVFVFPFDVVLVMACVLAVPAVVRRFRHPNARDPLCALSALVVLTVGAAVVHWSPQAVQSVLRLAGCVALVVAVISLPSRLRPMALGGLVLAALLESAMGVAQAATRNTLGWAALGEYAGSLWQVGTAVAPRGTFVHQYMLDGWVLVAAAACLVLIRNHVRRPLTLAVGLALLVVPVGLTFSRAAGLSVVAMALALAVPGPDAPRRRLAAMALVVGVGIAALCVSGGWLTRARASTPSGDFTSDRGEHVEESLQLIRRHPLVGVGPGRYVYALQKELGQGSDVTLAPVHNFVLLAAAESGIPAGVAAMAFVVALGVVAARGGAWSAAAYAAYFPNLMLDHFPFTTPHGLVMTAVWVAAVLLLAQDQEAGERA